MSASDAPQMTAFERSVHRAQITNTSMAMETIAQIGWYGSQMKLTIRLMAASTTPVARAQPHP